ncbi:hypothetical protein Dgeo_2972 (plasmid) [Deinococcus geothermalis DSM 11300]|uniref:HTH marR-type domain-containing protein n=1 Tax=Deinococcus geothermalis (strain DSM 11300 / CIP 105573 / AG-3a) TaxID=319795 RepID=A8ZRA6_DEIGD|nr:hypothetical protein Dgeo_2972 [Deinococcus geothermalis DSM 11300]
MLQALADQGGTSDTAALNTTLRLRPAELLRILNRCVANGLVTRTDHPDRDLPRRPQYRFTLTGAGRARLDSTG